MKMTSSTVARFAQALSSPTRVRILELLHGASLCVNALASRLEVTQGAVSQHLRVLRDAGLVVPEKRGYFVHYRLDPAGLAKYQALLSHLLGAEPRRSRSRQTKTANRRCKPCAQRKQSVKSPRNSGANPSSARPSRSRSVTAT
jgi:DNA-binding transcriptional ArsR family regulator